MVKNEMKLVSPLRLQNGMRYDSKARKGIQICSFIFEVRIVGIGRR